MLNKNRLIAIALLLLGATSALAEREPVDRIVAVVGNEVILASELATQLQLVALQTGKQPRTPEEVKEFQNSVLEQMISDQLILAEAKKDTSISIRPEEIDRSLNDQIKRISSRYSSNDEFLAQLADEGLTLRLLEKRYRGEIKNQLLKQRFIQTQLLDISVSRREVEEFFDKFKEEIPAQPEAAKLSHLQLAIAPSKSVEDSVKALAQELRTRVLDGADLATLSVQYSSFGAGANGGDLGYVSRTDVVPEFARAAFRLNVGEISGAIRTQFGYHVILCEAKRSDLFKLRHILLGVIPSAEDSAAAYVLADSLMKEIRNGKDFAELAKIYSSDNSTRATGGELGWFSTSELPPDFAVAVNGWTTPGELRGPVSTEFGLHILKLLDYQPEKQYSLPDDFDKIKQLARQDKTGKVVDDLIEEYKARAYIDYRLEESDKKDAP